MEADRVVLDSVRESMLHLVRNAVDHGVEPPAVREAAGKPREGAVTVSAALRGDRIVVAVQDDGAGVDTAQVRAYIDQHNVPYNPLHDKGFVSIGCAPCTRAIRAGEDFRAGRWWWEDNSKKECGLHAS